MRYDLAIFDFDGTLADSFPWFSAVLDDLAETHGLARLDAAEREALRGATSREILQRMRVPLWKLPAIATDVRARKRAVAKSIPLFDGVPDVLHELAAREVMIAIVSSDSEPSVRETLGAELAGLVRHYDCEASLFGKARKLRGALRATRVEAPRAICVGDEDRDAVAAAEAGIAFGAVAWGYARRDALLARSPAVVFERVADLARIAG